jgi:hypothetical protein
MIRVSLRTSPACHPFPFLFFFCRNYVSGRPNLTNQNWNKVVGRQPVAAAAADEFSETGKPNKGHAEILVYPLVGEARYSRLHDQS